MTDTVKAVEAHYANEDLGATILGALRSAGKSIEPIDPDDLAPIDHFHLCGRDATLDLARVARVGPGMRVIDVGGGLGGPARLLARDFGCEVTVLDATDEFCRVGADLTERAGLAERVHFQHGDALATGRRAKEFDVAWMQHASMNIADKARLYRELWRVTRPGGRLAFHEIVAGPAGPIHFPVPWARDASLSFLAAPGDVRRLLASVGFDEVFWQDESATALDWLQRRMISGVETVQPRLGLHLLLPRDYTVMFRNLARNIAEERVTVIKAVWDRR